LINAEEYVRLQPVYDNGCSFFGNSISHTDDKMVLRKGIGRNLMKDGARAYTCIYLDNKYHHIKPEEYIALQKNEDCMAAVMRIKKRWDVASIRKLLDDVPEHAHGIPVMSNVRREYYKGLLLIKLGILDIAEMLLGLNH
jgi:hypothetical protein